MKNLLLVLLASLSLVAMPTSKAFAQEEVDDIFMDEGTPMDDVPPADGGEVAGPVTEEEAAPAEEPAAEKPVKKAKPTVDRPSRAADRVMAPKPKVNRKTASAKGGFRVLKTDCPLHQDASDGSAVILTSKTSMKLWVEEQNDEWVKGYHKGGSGFFSKNCFE